MKTIVQANPDFFVISGNKVDGDYVWDDASPIIAWVIEDFIPQNAKHIIRYLTPWPISVELFYGSAEFSAIIQPNGKVVDTDRGVYENIASWKKAIETNP